MPILGTHTEINPAQLQQFAAQDAQAHQHAIQQDLAGPALLFVAGLVLLVCARDLRRAAVRGLRLIDRAAYAIGIDSRRIVARWNERG